MKTLLVTGAAGSVGNYVVGLAESQGYRVVATDRRAKGLRVPVRGEVRAGDLRSDAFVEHLVVGVDAVIHTAAQLDAGADEAELARVNVDAVATLFHAAAKENVKRFVHMSTAMLYAAGQKGPLDEDSPVAPRGPHGMSKHGAETFLRGQSTAGAPTVTIVRAAPIYGRRGRHFAASLLAIGPMLRLASPLVPRMRGGPLGTMVHAEDVARALLFLLPRTDVAGQIFNVSDGDIMTLGDRVAETFRGYGLPTIPVGRAPDSVLRRLGALFRAPGAYQGADAAALTLWRAVVLRHGLKPALSPRLDREAWTLLYDDLVVDAGRLLGLGFVPRFPRFAEGFAEVLRWYQAEGWVPRYA